MEKKLSDIMTRESGALLALEIIKLKETIPNDMDLGKEVRKLINLYFTEYPSSL